MGFMYKRAIKFFIMYLLMFLIGLNFFGNAVLLVYLFTLFVFLFFRHSLVVPRIIIFIILLFICILLSIVINETGISIYSMIKFGVYPLFFLSFYEIGECVREYDDNGKVIKVFYGLIFSFVLGNMGHMIADISISDLSSLNLGSRILNDVWSHGTVPTTILVGWGCLTAPVFLYAFEKRKNSKIILLINALMLAIYMFYSLVVATRLGIVNSLLIVVLFIIFMCRQKDITINFSSILKICIALIIIIISTYKLMPYVMSSNLYIRMTSESLSMFDSNGRLAATVYLIRHFTEDLWGGEYFVSQYGLQQHNALFQMYDLYGIFPFVLFLVILIVSIINTARIHKSAIITSSDKRFIVLFFVALMLYCFEEPAISSNYIVTGMIFAYVGFSYAVIKYDVYSHYGGTDGI